MLGFIQKIIGKSKGQSLVELLVAMGLASLLIPAILIGITASRGGRAQHDQRVQAVSMLKDAQEAVRSIGQRGWSGIATNGTFHPVISGSVWTLSSGSTNANGFTTSVVITDALRNSSGAIVNSGGTPDPATKKVVTTVSWNTPINSQVSATSYFSRNKNAAYSETTVAQFNGGIRANTQVTNDSGGEIKLINNNKAKWCSPSFNAATIDLPDGPPVAVAATASSTTINTPNDAYVVTSPTTSNSIKLAHVNVTANTDPPQTTQRGKFTLNPSEYSNSGLVPSGIGIDNNFRTTDVKYYKSSGGSTYALIGTNLPNKEVIAVQVNDGNDNSNSEYQDPTNKIYKYKTFFNTRMYAANTASQPNQDQSPFGYGASSVAVLGDRGYVASGGYLYVFNLGNIDSKSSGSGLDMLGCRIQINGYECTPGSPGQARKYGSGQTGTSWGDTTSPIHNDCSDGGNIELLATNDIYPVAVGNNTYVFVAVGGVTDRELEIVNVTTVPTSSRSDDASCGRITTGDSTWRVSGGLDFNNQSGTEEAANSVFAKSDGTRAYISSNGGIDANNNGQPDSKQFYIINTANKSSPSFISGTSAGPTSGFYLGTGANGEMFPRRSLTVLNGERVVLVGRDGISNTNDSQEYQVLNSETEASPAYCAGLNFDQGFNDLTSVSELDSDNYVYMVANTTLNELKIIEGGPDDAIYVSNGSFESQVFNATQESMFNRFFATSTIPSNTTLTYQVAIQKPINGSCLGVTYSYVGPDGTGNTYFTTPGELPRSNDGSGYENAGQCMRYKVFMNSTNQQQTPVLYDFGVNYSL
jgi:type II secretory pathway pseudopilin PulG